MQKFLKRLIFFISLPLVYVSFNLILNTFFIDGQKLELNKNKIFIFGDSHTDDAINPEYLKNSSNFSNSAEPYFFTYHKAKKFIEIYKPDIIIVGFSHHNVSKFGDHAFSNKISPVWSYEMFKRSFDLINLNQIPKAFEVNLFSYYKALIMEKGIYPKKNKIKRVGYGFNNNFKSDVSDPNKVIKRHFYDQKKEYGFSQVSIKYLDSIISLCNTNKIELVLVNTPVHKAYSKKIPNIINEKYNKLKEKFIQNNVKYFEDTVNIYPDTLFRNPDHLNLYGSEKFSKELSRFLKDSE